MNLSACRQRSDRNYPSISETLAYVSAFSIHIGVKLTEPAGVPLEQVQALCGHESIMTTEIYVKLRWRGTIEPNRRVVGE